MAWGDLISSVNLVTDMKKKDVADVLVAAMDVMKATLVKGKDVSLLGIGSLKPVVRAARKGINPKTKESIDIPEKKSARLVLSKSMKDALNLV